MADTATVCPLCQSNSNKLISHSLYKCKNCKSSFNNNYQQLSYDSCYFFDDYRKQYGKTYEEDFHSIYTFSIKRLKSILGILRTNKRPITDLKLLDIGSAMGFFLKGASDLGIGHVSGIEISEHAARYCRDTYNIPVQNCSFEDADKGREFDIITSWYFIEHLYDPLHALQTIYSMLKSGGIFACSIPSIFGPTYLFNKKQWAATHPQDHRIDLSPASARKVFKSSGFKKITTIPAAIHPERLLKNTNPLYKPFSTLYTRFSHATSFSDTLEIYAMK